MTCLFETLPSVLDELLCCRLRRSDEKRLVQVPVIAAVIDSHVNIHNVAVLKTRQVLDRENSQNKKTDYRSREEIENNREMIASNCYNCYW